MNADRDGFATTRWARSSRPRGLPESLAYTLLVLATYANERGECWPGVERLMHDLELSDRAVRRRLERLRELGLVTVHRRPNRSSLIRLAVPERVAGPVAQDDLSAAPGPVAQGDLSGVNDDRSGSVVQGVRSGPVVHARAGKERQENAKEHHTPQPPQAGARPSPREGGRKRDHARHLADLAAWSPHPNGTLAPDLAAAWDQAATLLKSAVPESSFATWLADLHPHQRNGDTIVLGGPPGRVGWTERRYGRLLRDVLGAEVVVVPCDHQAPRRPQDPSSARRVDHTASAVSQTGDTDGD